MRKTIILLLFILPFFCAAQKRSNVWCFGDSSLIDFSDTTNIITGTSRVKSRGSCASIADSSGHLLLYAAYDPTVLFAGTFPIKVYNRNHQVILNGDSIKGGGWYHEILIIDNPYNVNQYYVFSIGVTDNYGLYYSIVDMSANGFMGAVIQKNIQLESTHAVDCLSAVKHGNGRDWWIIFRRLNNPSAPNNKYFVYLITPSGVSNASVQTSGSLISTNFGNICFNSSGSKFAFTNYKGLLELYDFDRCTGIINNPQNIYPENLQSPWPQGWGLAFSPSDQILYETQIASFSGDICRLVQFDLNTSNISSSADTLWTSQFIENIGALKLAPDGKIYMAHNYKGGYPYVDTTYNNYNSYLSVINSPDSLGTACNFQPYSFYLGGKRTYFGLPNNPDYDMPALAGSPCDSLTTSVSNGGYQETKPQLFVTYISGWQKLFVNAQNLEGKNRSLQIFDITGKLIFSNVAGHSPLGAGGNAGGYFTTDINCTAVAKGMYIVTLTTESEKLSAKFIKD